MNVQREDSGPMFTFFLFNLCPPLMGQLVDSSGHPAPGVKVVREWNWAWKDKNYSDQTVTDENGFFKFSGTKKSSFFGKFLPHEPQITIEVKAEINGALERILFYGKTNYDVDLPVSDDPQNLPPNANVACFIDKQINDPSLNGFYSSRCVSSEKATLIYKKSNE